MWSAACIVNAKQMEGNFFPRVRTLFLTRSSRANTDVLMSCYSAALALNWNLKWFCTSVSNLKVKDAVVQGMWKCSSNDFDF